MHDCQSMEYYSEGHFLAEVDKTDCVLNKIDRWEAHIKGILHRGFTIGVFYKEQLICQHRRHPVFDGYLDLTASSHPLALEDTVQDDLEAIYKTLEREWGILEENLATIPRLQGKTAYKARHNKYIEHEICSLYVTEIETLPSVNLDYAYGFSLLTPSDLSSSRLPFTEVLSPWVKAFLKQKLI